MSTEAETYLSISNTSDVIHNLHSIAIRYHLLQDDHKDEALSVGEYCYIVLNDRQHPTYLVSAVITSVNCSTYEYTVQRINDNKIETYPWNQIVVEYNKKHHSVNIEQHQQKLVCLRNTQLLSPVIQQQQNALKRKREDSDCNNESQPNKKRKLNSFDIDTQQLRTVAQPYFPIPHPYFRQNALIKWKSSSSEWDVGRIVDFEIDCDKIYVQNTYQCGTKDDEECDIFCITEWNKFVDEKDCAFISDIYLYRLHSRILYWWDRAGCGSVCEDSIEGLDYAADNELIYGITGGKKKKKKKKNESLKWCHKDGIFEATFSNKVSMSKYISKNYKPVKSLREVKKASVIESKLLDVVIIGAGIAGLTARWALNKYNYSSKTMEAQDYIGGRLKQHEFPSKLVCDPLTMNTYFVPRVSVELGAAFLSGSGADNRFWSWLKKQNRNVCADWGGYNNGWWNGDSFIDAKNGEFVHKKVIERIKDICDDIQTLACKLLMPLDDISVIDALEYMKHRIPHNQLFTNTSNSDENNTKIVEYFYFIYDKYKILSANWVGAQGLWQQQQTVELQTLDFEALYQFLYKIFGNEKNGKKYLRATERIIIDYYGDKTNIKTENFNVDRIYNQYNDNNNNNENDIDSEATESEINDCLPLIPLHVEWNDSVVRYDKSDYGEFVPFQYKFGYKNILVRDIIHPPLNEEEARELQKTCGLSPIDYQRFKNALQYLADCNLFSFHLYFLRSSAQYKTNEKAQKLLQRFKQDLALFDEIVDDFRNILIGKELRMKQEHHQTLYHNRKTMRNKNNNFVHELKKQSKLHEKIDCEFKQNVFDATLSLNPAAEILGDGFVVNGYSQILEAFITESDIKAAKDISINHRVCSVERICINHQQVSEVRGIDLVSGKPFCLWSRFVICSVPLGVLKLSLSEKKDGEFNGGIQFKPQLSANKQEAIDSMAMGVENKVYLRFTKCFWPRDKPYFQSIQHPQYRFINLSYDGFQLKANTNVLCTMIPPNVARKWKIANPAQELRIIWDVLRVLNEMFKERQLQRKEDDNILIHKNDKMDVEEIKATEEEIKHQYSDIDECKLNAVDINLDELVFNNNNKQRICAVQDNKDGIVSLLRLLVDYKVTDWQNNLFTRGSYSYLPKGAVYTHCKSLQEYDGNGVYFCGEATSVEGFECVDGAHETGFNVAKEIHKKLQEMKLESNI